MIFLNGWVQLHQGDCVEVLSRLEPESVDCVVTSPPYWGLRDYGVEGQIGLEPTLAQHLKVMVSVFELVRRVLKPEGTLWVNYGDCYAATPAGRTAAETKAVGRDNRTFRDKPFSTIQGSMKPRDLCLVPNRFAIAMQDAGWWVRSEIIWAKPNPMPESILDRPATAHEKIWLMTKSPKYFYDAAAVRQGRVSDENASSFRGGSYVGGNPGKRAEVGNVKVRGARRPHEGLNQTWDKMTKAEQQQNGRNLRNYEPAPVSVWNIATRPFSDAHFATFPPELAERCILAGCPKGGLVLDPFGGAGTTALVALRHGRRASLIEINPDYAEMTRARIEKEWRVMPRSTAAPSAGPLFEWSAQ